MAVQVVTDRTPARSLLIYAAIFCAMGCVSCAGGDDAGGVQIVEMTTGSYRTVADSRAELWIGKFDRPWREDIGQLTDTVEVEIRCGEDRQTVWVSADRLTEPVCGVQLQLVEITTWNPPKAKIKVAWDGR